MLQQSYVGTERLEHIAIVDSPFKLGLQQHYSKYFNARSTTGAFGSYPLIVTSQKNEYFEREM